MVCSLNFCVAGVSHDVPEGHFNVSVMGLRRVGDVSYLCRKLDSHPY